MAVPELNRWPEHLHSLCQKYGRKAVMEIGSKAIGFPAFWAHTHKEFRAIALALAKHFSQKD